MAYPLPTEHERRALFGWLEQASSLTAWRRLYTYLSPVPIAHPELLVNTGRIIPHYGIWEPVVVKRQPGIFGAWRGPQAPPSGGRLLDGCMNYLHGGSAAPTLAFEGDGQRKEGRHTA